MPRWLLPENISDVLPHEARRVEQDDLVGEAEDDAGHAEQQQAAYHGAPRPRPGRWAGPNALPGFAP